MERSRFGGLGLDAATESAYRALLDHPSCTITELATHLGVGADKARHLVDQLRDLDLARVAADGIRVRPVDPRLGLSALAARLDAELATRRQQLEQARQAIADLATSIGRINQPQNGHVADVCWGAHDIKVRTAQLTAAASSEVVAMSSSSAVVLDETMLPDRRIDGVCYRLAFSELDRPEPARTRWLHALADNGADVRIGRVPTSALIIDSATVALPVCDSAAGQTVGLATLRLPSAVTAVVELFERVWADATPLAGQDSGETSGLGPRERDLLALLVAGTTDESAACRLGVSVRTVRRMVSDLMNRLGARSRFEAGARAAERGWLQQLLVESH